MRIILLGNGHYLYLMETDLRPSYFARLETQFLDISDTWIMGSYQVFGKAVISVYVRSEEYVDTKVSG